jgi:hypothetical protein
MMSSSVRNEAARLRSAEPSGLFNLAKLLEKGSLSNSLSWRLGAIGVTGLLLGATVVLALAPLPAGAESNDTGVLGFFRGERLARRAAPPGGYTTIISPRGYAPSPSVNPFLPKAIQRGDLGGLDGGKKRVSTVINPRTDKNTGSSGLTGIGKQTICVRTCDGFYFPLGRVGEAASADAQEGLCRAACPDAEVRLFTLAEGAKDIEKAVSRDLKSYASLRTAFLFQRRHDRACTCNRAGVSPKLSIYRDITLRAGDTVVMNNRARVFRGSRQWPYRDSDFADFASANAKLNASTRADIDRVVGASHYARSLKPFRYAKLPSKGNRKASTPQRPANRAAAAPPVRERRADGVRVIGLPAGAIR